MAKTRSLPDKFYDKDYEHNGIHRVPLWRIAGYALNNTATNVYLMMMNYATYYLMGWVGVGMMVASSLTMAMRIWDGVTDPFVGFMVDKTNGKFGKNRPFMVIGNILLAVTSFVAFHVTHNLPQAARFPFYVVVLMVYYLGYTCQCVVTKSAQSCMTNDPKQRPMFASFDGVFNTLLFAILGIIIPRIADGYTDVGGYASTQFMHTLWLMTAIMSACFTVIAVISITPKDRPEFFGTGKPVKVFAFRKELAQQMEALGMDPSYAERYLNVGFSGGEKKKSEILQLLMLKPSLALLDETDSGLDVDAVRLVSKGVEEYQKDHNGALLIITHSTRILDALSVDYTHVLVNGKIAANGDGSLVEEINVNGYERFEKMAEA